MRRSGMFRTVAAANAIIALRCGLLNGRFEDYWGAVTCSLSLTCICRAPVEPAGYPINI
jgi:hypothetical protein